MCLSDEHLDLVAMNLLLLIFAIQSTPGKNNRKRTFCAIFIGLERGKRTFCAGKNTIFIALEVVPAKNFDFSRY